MAKYDAVIFDFDGTVAYTAADVWDSLRWAARRYRRMPLLNGPNALGDALKIRLCAPPVDGAANAALIEFLSDFFSLPRARVQLLSGATSRNKRVLLAGLPAAKVSIL